MKELGQQTYEDHIAYCLKKGWKPIEGDDISWNSLPIDCKKRYAKREKARAYAAKVKLRKSFGIT